jgi:hypothetical protein
MTDIQYHKDLSSLIGGTHGVVFDTSFIELKSTPQLVENSKLLGIESEIIGDKVRLITSSIRTKVFGSIDSFLKIKEITSSSDFLIFDGNNVISYIDNSAYVNFTLDKNYFLIGNTQTYLQFQNFLKEQEKEVDGTFHFVDSYNKDLRKIIFVSLSEKGRLNISYNILCPLFDTSKDISSGFKRYQECFSEENGTLAKFLKSSTISIVSNFPAETRFRQFVENLNEIVDKARINFDVYLNELSIDKIKKDYDDVKSKYFNNLSEILSKLSQNILVLPIGIAGILFAIEKIKDSPAFLYLLIAAISITSIYISLLLRIHFRDLIYISKVFNYDFNTLIENNFFKKYPEESVLFDEIKTRIMDRVTFLKFIVESYFWVMNLSNVFILDLLLHYLKVKEMGIVFITIGILLIVTLARNFILSRSEYEEKNGV